MKKGTVKSKKTLLTAFCLVLSFCLTAHAQNKPPCVADVEKMLIEAENTESYEKLSDANADKCVGQNPKSVEALIMRSRIFILKKNFTAADSSAVRITWEMVPAASKTKLPRLPTMRRRSSSIPTMEPLCWTDPFSNQKVMPSILISFSPILIAPLKT
jgi:hypothetical protein